MGTIEVMKPGMMSSVQDAGREGHRNAGVPRSGAFDSIALSVGNRLLGNSESDAAIEMTITGGDFRFTADTVVCITGAHAEDAMVFCGDHKHSLLHQRPTAIPIGSTLRVGRLTRGIRGYLCISGGVQSPSILGSQSTLVSLPDAGLGCALIQGSSLSFDERIKTGKSTLYKSSVEVSDTTRDGMCSLRIVPGADFEQFTELQREALVCRTFTVSDQSNRAGVRLSASIIPDDLPAKIGSEGTIPGYVQVPPSASPIILGVDGPTTGGYPVIACVIEADLPLLAQCGMREQMQFRWVSRSEAVNARVEQYNKIQSIQPLHPIQLPWRSPNA